MLREEERREECHAERRQFIERKEQITGAFTLQLLLRIALAWKETPIPVAIAMASIGSGGNVDTATAAAPVVKHDGVKQELERIKEECSGMINTLKALHDEEKRLKQGNQILAQHAVMMGCTAGFDTGAKRGAGRKRPASAAAASSSTSTTTAANINNLSTKKTKAAPQATTPSKGTPPVSKIINLKVGAPVSKVKVKCEKVLSVIAK